MKLSSIPLLLMHGGGGGDCKEVQPQGGLCVQEDNGRSGGPQRPLLLPEGEGRLWQDVPARCGAKGGPQPRGGLAGGPGHRHHGQGAMHLPLGRTSHSRFKALLTPSEDCTFSMKAQSEAARLIREAELIM